MKILIFVGPPKTGTRYLSTFLNQINEDVLMRNGWTWPASCPNATRKQQFLNGKAFSAFPEALSSSPNKQLVHKHCPGLDEAENFLAYYRELFHVEYEKEQRGERHFNVALGTEYFMPKLSNKGNHKQLFNGLLSMMPWNDNITSSSYETAEQGTFKEGTQQNEMAAVVMYRTPRYSHLVSSYDQSRIPTKQKKAVGKQVTTGSFPEYLCDLDESSPSLKYNPLGIAKVLRDHNVPVKIINMAGVKKNGLDIADVVVCNIMAVPCDNAGKISFLSNVQNDNSRSHENVKMPLEMQMKIENVLLSLDCYYQQILEDDNSYVEFLYGDEMFSHCKRLKQANRPPLTQKEAYSQIKQIGCNAVQFESDKNVLGSSILSSISGGDRYVKGFETEPGDPKLARNQSRTYIEKQTQKQELRARSTTAKKMKEGTINYTNVAEVDKRVNFVATSTTYDIRSIDWMKNIDIMLPLLILSFVLLLFEKRRWTRALQ